MFCSHVLRGIDHSTVCWILLVFACIPSFGFWFLMTRETQFGAGSIEDSISDIVAIKSCETHHCNAIIHQNLVSATPLYIKIFLAQLTKTKLFTFWGFLVLTAEWFSSVCNNEICFFSKFCIFLNSKSKIDYPREFAMIEFEYVSRKWTKVSKKLTMFAK